MSPGPTHWDPKHTDLKDGCNTVHCRHFNLALDSSRLLVIDRSKSYPVQLIRTTRQRESHSIINSQKAAKRNLTGRPLRGKERKSLSAHNDCRVFSGWRSNSSHIKSSPSYSGERNEIARPTLLLGERTLTTRVVNYTRSNRERYEMLD